MRPNRALFVVLSLSLLGCEANQAPPLNGYVEADAMVIGAPTGGWITRIAVKPGQRIRPGDLLFAMDDTAQRAERERAVATLAQAEANAKNLSTGRRPDEMAILKVSVREAEAANRFAQNELQRQQTLLTKGYTTVKAVEAQRANAQAARARLDNAKAQVAAGSLGGRSDELAAARAAVASARAALAQADYGLSQRQITATREATIEDILRETGEFVPAQGGVLQAIPADASNVRFFVPEALRAQIKLGTKISVRCTGCPSGLTASVRFINTNAEFTPPIIFSQGARDKLVWAVEAQPDQPDRFPSPG